MKFMRHNLIPDIILFHPQKFADDRGYFFESYQDKRYREAGIRETFVQDNMSHSKKNTLRGLHYQLKFPQGKLVGVTRGKVYDVIVDIRKNSPTFGKWASFELSSENCMQVYIPPGFAHGFYVLSDSADFYYKCTEYYAVNDECGIIWNDKTIGITWPLQGEPLISKKDLNHPAFSQLAPDLLPT